MANPLAKLLEVINVFGDKSQAADVMLEVTRDESNIGWQGHDPNLWASIPGRETLVEAITQLKREEKTGKFSSTGDPQLNKDWTNELLIKYPELGYGSWSSFSDVEENMQTPEWTSKINKLRQKLIPATDDPYGVYTPLLDPVVVKGAN